MDPKKKKKNLGNLDRPMSCFDLYSDINLKDANGNDKTMGSSYTQSLGRNTVRNEAQRRRRRNLREYFRNSKLVFLGTFFRRRHLFKKKNDKRDAGKENILRFPDISPNFDPKLHCKALNYEDGQLVSGRLDELIKLLIPTRDRDNAQMYYPDRNYIFTFLLCSRLFLSPESVLERVYEMTKENVKENEEQAEEILKMVVQLLQEWTAHFPYDFKKKVMMEQFNMICTMCKATSSATLSSINLISSHLVCKFDDLLRYMNEHNVYQIPCDDTSTPLLDICSDPCTMAMQLTIMELEKLTKVSPEQFIERFIAEDVTVSKLDLTKHTTPLEMYVHWFNRLSLLVPTEICACAKQKDRIKIINFFIEVAKHCLKLGNFNSLMAIVVGLNMNSVLRMATTWAKCNDASFKRLERAVSPQRNFHRYRKKLKARLCGGCEYVIPVFSIFVKDMYVLNEGIKDRLPNDLVNVQKCWHISKQVNDMMMLKSKSCTYTIDTEVMEYLLNTPVCTEDMLYKASFDVEQPTTDFERNRYQSVRLRLKKGQPTDHHVERPFSVA